MNAGVAGVGCALGAHTVTNGQLERELGLPSGWIQQRTGIRERRIAAQDEATSDLAISAAKRAMRQARLSHGVARSSIATLILATSTPDYLLPPTAPYVADQLGLNAVEAFDLAAACTGFVYAVKVADALVRTSRRPVLVVASNVLSRRVRADDPVTRPLFADGAGAVVFIPTEANRGVLSTHLESDGSRWEQICIPAGGSRCPATPDLLGDQAHLISVSDGAAVFRAAVEGMVRCGKIVLERCNLQPADVDWWVPHQANLRIIHEVGRRMGVGRDQTAVVIDYCGNASAATIPIALAEWVESGKLCRGHTVLLTAAGAGFTSGAAVIRW